MALIDRRRLLEELIGVHYVAKSGRGCASNLTIHESHDPTLGSYSIIHLAERVKLGGVTVAPFHITKTELNDFKNKLRSAFLRKRTEQTFCLCLPLSPHLPPPRGVQQKSRQKIAPVELVTIA